MPSRVRTTAAGAPADRDVVAEVLVGPIGVAATITAEVAAAADAVTAPSRTAEGRPVPAAQRHDFSTTPVSLRNRPPCAVHSTLQNARESQDSLRAANSQNNDVQ